MDSHNRNEQTHQFLFTKRSPYDSDLISGEKGHFEDIKKIETSVTQKVTCVYSDFFSCFLLALLALSKHCSYTYIFLPY